MPHPNDIEFNELYYNYLRNPNFNRSVNGGVIAKNNSTESSVNEYIQLFRRVSAFGKKSVSNLGLSWEPEYFLNTIKYIYEYIDNEKSVLNYKMSLFGMGEEGEKRFVMLGDFIAMLSAQAHFSNVYTDDVKAAVNNVKKLLNEIGISTITLGKH